MGQQGTKTVAKRMASTNAPMKVTNKHFVLGNPIQGPFPDGMEKCVVGTGTIRRFFVSIHIRSQFNIASLFHNDLTSTKSI